MQNKRDCYLDRYEYDWLWMYEWNEWMKDEMNIRDHHQAHHTFNHNFLVELFVWINYSYV